MDTRTQSVLLLTFQIRVLKSVKSVLEAHLNDNEQSLYCNVCPTDFRTNKNELIFIRLMSLKNFEIRTVMPILLAISCERLNLLFFLFAN